MMLIGSMHQAVLDAGFARARVPGVRVASLIAIDRLLIAIEQTIRRLGVRDRGMRHMDAANDGVACVHTRVDIVVEHTLFALASPAGIRIRRWFGRRILRILAWRIGPRLDQRSKGMRTTGKIAAR
jgi:hypothetical protein